MKSFDRRKFLTALGLSTAGAATVLANQNITSGLAGFENLSGVQDAPNDIKITNVTTFKVKRALFIKIETNAGVTGWGESSSNSPREVVESFIMREMRKTVIGMNPFDT